MKADEKIKLTNALTNISEDLIEEALAAGPAARPAARHPGWMKWSAAVASLGVLLIVGFSLFPRLLNRDPGLTIPPVDPPKVSEGTLPDMIGMIRYQDHTYVQAASYIGEEAEKIRPLLDERLGRASGTLDEGSDQNELSEEFASTYLGEVYSVKGYSKDFRLGIVFDPEDGPGQDPPMIVFLERLNGIRLTTGADLFGDRLQMENNWRSVQFQKHADWDRGREVYHDLADQSGDSLMSLIGELFAGGFEAMDSELYLDARGDQGHLIFRMKDHTKVEVRLMEGGYVLYEHLPGYFVRLSGEAFEAILKAIQ